MKAKKILPILVALTLVTALSVFTISASAFDEDAVLGAITANYSKALELAGRGSFHGNCNLATAPGWARTARHTRGRTRSPRK